MTFPRNSLRPHNSLELRFAKMSNEEFTRLASAVEQHLGIKMVLAKKEMIAARLLKRLKRLGLSRYRDYYEYLRSPSGQHTELKYFSDLVTTHTTEFFRESDHFEYLQDVALPKLLKRRGQRSTLKFWSAGCSTGEEAYSLAMTMEDCLTKTQLPRSEYSILGTDVSEFALHRAATAIYAAGSADQIPRHLRSRFLLKSRCPDDARVRIVPELRERVSFEPLNFIDDTWHVQGPFDLILCRNVLIYFERARQATIIKKLLERLHVDGYLLLGHAEGTHGLGTDTQLTARSVYQKTLPRPELSRPI